VILSLAFLLALLVSATVWATVSQIEHYIAGRATRTASRWLALDRAAQLQAAAVVVTALVCVFLPYSSSISVIGVAVAAAWPARLCWRIWRTKRPVLTRRFWRLAAAAACLIALGVAGFTQLPEQARSVAAPVLALVLGPAVLDASAALLAPVERALARQFVVAARKKLRSISPTVIAITGSYGKTSVKNHLAHLISDVRQTSWTPASYNNLLGISRAINQGLTPGTEVFIVEMGTYGPGEIAEMTKNFPASIACITAIGDVHLERMGSRANILLAKSEIVENCETAVLCVDYPELAELADHLRQSRPDLRVLRVSAAAGTEADVSVTEHGDEWLLRLGEETHLVRIPEDAVPQNVALACALAHAAGAPATAVVRAIPTLPAVSHRAVVQSSPGLPSVIDDTFNSNPQGARLALSRAQKLAATSQGRLFVISPGMVELGDKQFVENETFAFDVAQSSAEFLIVGKINQEALTKGFLRGRGDAGDRHPNLASSRDDAANSVLALASEADVILFENDLPVTYP
jgi:UDP-N-acetylmuramoyl-tripeptide--D-alanyl-D-alanine ligase